MKQKKNKTTLRAFWIALACIMIIPMVLSLFSLGDGTNGGNIGGGGGVSNSGTQDKVDNNDSEQGGGSTDSGDVGGGSGSVIESETAVTHTLASVIDQSWINSMANKGKHKAANLYVFCEKDGFFIGIDQFNGEYMLAVGENGITKYNYVNATTAEYLNLSGPGWIDSNTVQLINESIDITIPEGTELYISSWSLLYYMFEN